MQGSSPASPAGPRLWRPAAQRNLRNSWSAISTQLSTWAAASAKALSAASALFNAHLSERYVASMDFGVLEVMDGIRVKARKKFFRQAEGFYEELMKSYKELVECLANMKKTKGSMRTYVKGSAKGPIIEFSDNNYLNEDMGDGDGVAVFSTFSLHTHEMLAEELLTMFQSEIAIKWLLVVEFHRILYSGMQSGHWKKQIAKEMIHHAFLETSSHIPCLVAAEEGHGGLGDTSNNGSTVPAKREVLQVYLTAWLAEVNIKWNRIEEILKMMNEEIQLTLPTKYS